MRTSEILNLAADQIESRGWITGSAGWNSKWRGNKAPLCLEGGIMAAMSLQWDEILEEGVEDSWRACPAYVAVNEYLGNEADAPLWRFNDREAGTAERVIEVLRGAALVEAAKEEAGVSV